MAAACRPPLRRPRPGAASLYLVGSLLLSAPSAVAQGNATNATELTGATEAFDLGTGTAIAVLIVATLALVSVIAGLGWVHDRLEDRFSRFRLRREPEIKIGSMRIQASDWLRSLLTRAIDAVRAILVIAITLVYIPFALGLFDPTRALANRIIHLFSQNLSTAGQALRGYVPNLVSILFIALVAWLGLKVLRTLFEEIYKGRVTFKGFYPSWGRPTYTLIRFVILAFVLVLILPKLPGFGTESFQGISLFIGALVALGASSAMANVVSGVVLTYTRAFSPGDRVQISDTMGDVMGRTLLVTRVRTAKNVDITIPNAMVLSSHIVNYSQRSQDQGIILHTSVSIGYEVPWRTVRDLLVQAAKRTEGFLEEPEPFVLQTELGDFAITYEINGYTDKPASMNRIRSRLHANIQDAFADAGIEILSPTHQAFRSVDDTLPPPLEGDQGPDPEPKAVEHDAGDAVTEPDAESARAEAEAQADAAAEEAWEEQEDAAIQEDPPGEALDGDDGVHPAEGSGEERSEDQDPSA